MTTFDELRNRLLQDVKGIKKQQDISPKFQSDFFKLVEMVIFALMHRDDNFFGSCAVQMKRNIDLEMQAAAGVTADLTHFNLVLNPKIFLRLNLNQMKAEVKHQIYHIMMMHLQRSKNLKGKYSPFVLNTAMDVAVNQYISDLPSWHPKLKNIQERYEVELPPEAPFETYCQIIQEAISKMERTKASNQSSSCKTTTDPGQGTENEEIVHHQDKCHDIWDKSKATTNLENMRELAKNIAKNANRGQIPAGLEEQINRLTQRPALNWQDILKRTVGTLPAGRKKTITRKDRRQPERYDLRGKLPQQVVKLLVAVDTSASMSPEQLEKCFAEIFGIVEKYRHEVTVIHCDAKVQKVYRAKTTRDVDLNIKGRGGTAFSPVFQYIRQEKLMDHMLIYFTDGYGEKRLDAPPVNQRTLWVIAGQESNLSLDNPWGMVTSLN
ncbi:putative metal-dependent peptidase [Desulfitispora alkaliphila]|uniref:vWA domain-containing protein n=1 Tax=Desulfitispora alkaliphila TaxID=622674 RepID=UPI003D260E7B